MKRAKQSERPEHTVNQIVAFNLTRARFVAGMTQEQAAAALEPYLGYRISKQNFSSMERSVDGRVARVFDANELVAFAIVFGVPLAFFFVPMVQNVRVFAASQAAHKTREISTRQLMRIAGDGDAAGMSRERTAERLRALAAELEEAE